MLTNKQEEKLAILCKRAFESLVGQIIIDDEETILYFSKEHVKFMGIDYEDAIGKKVQDIIPYTRMHIVLKTGIPEIGNIFEMKNRKTGEVKLMVCNRIPIRDENGKILGAMAETIFSRGVNDVHRLGSEINRHFDKNNFATEVDYYKDLFISTNEPSKTKERQTSGFLGSSVQSFKIREIIAKISNIPMPVLVTGETGTGKEVFAEALHLSSDDRRNKNFVKINCAAIPRELLESELFGYERGAFSGANSAGKIGKFEYAGAGTVLLDEIGDMSMELQSKLLRVLQEKSFERIGGLKSIPFNARIICTTNKNILELISEGKFREDLYYRINMMEVELPPLRERKEDIIDLSEAFIEKINNSYNLGINGIDSEALLILTRYDWPGNVRELKHVVERACMMKGFGELSSADFDFMHKDIFGNTQNIMTDAELDLRIVKEKVEKETILKALDKAEGNKALAARMLGIDRTILYDKIKKFGI